MTASTLLGESLLDATRRSACWGAVCLAAIHGLSCGGDSPRATVARSDDLVFEATLEPERARLEGNTLALRLTDAEGRPVDHAHVEVEATMAAMGAMPEMRSSAAVEPLGEGRYRAELDVPMAGTWQLAVFAEAPSDAGAVTFSFTVGRPGLLSLDSGSAVDPGTEGEPAEHADPAPPPDRVAAGAVRIDPRRWQTIGIRTTTAERRPLRSEVRAVGEVSYDETRLSEVSMKVAGWIGRLEADATGVIVHRGDTLFTLYSPELYAAQQELLAALESQRAARATAAPDRADYLVEASRQRLKLWDLPDEVIDRIAATGEPIQYLPIRSPVSGTVIEKSLVAGSAVEPGRTLYRIADLDRVWVEAELYEADLASVAEGQRAVVTLPHLAGRRFEGTVAFVHPTLEAASRTGRVRIELPNPDGTLRPQMYAEVTIAVEEAPRLVVPESAVIHAGTRRLVFRDLGQGRLEPREVTTGASSGGLVEILEGLEEGDAVVSSGTFLVAAESRLGAAEELWR